jgi:hypothetical protein
VWLHCGYSLGMKSVNQITQDTGDSSANEAARIRDREATVARAWRQVAFDEGEAACTADRIAAKSELPVAFVRFVCGNKGLDLR